MRNFINVFDYNNQRNGFKTAQDVRADIIGELEAIIQYENNIVSSDNQKAIQTWTDIVNEEKLHVGQLFALLFTLDPVFREMFEKGMNEFHNEGWIK